VPRAASEKAGRARRLELLMRPGPARGKSPKMSD
jgi:hypothetical protein